MIKEKSEKDFDFFVNFNQKRRNTLASQNNIQFKKLYQLNYLIYNILEQFKCALVEQKIKEADSKVIKKYIGMIKRDLVDSLDLINLMHFYAAKRTYRSVIETVLRLAGYSYRMYVYKKRKDNNKYVSTDQLKRLRSIIDTHKIGRFTKGILDEFKDSVVSKNFKILNKYYSDYSNITHTNSLESVDLSTDLNEILTKTSDEIGKIITDTYFLLANILLIIYFSEKLLMIDTISMQDFYFMKKLVNPVISEKQLENVSNNFAKGLNQNKKSML